MDSGTREALIAVCETLKVEAAQLVTIDSALATLYEALKVELPGLEKRLKGQAPSIRGSLDVGERIRSIDVLLEQLRKR